MKNMISTMKSVITSKTAAVTAFLLSAPAMAFAQEALPAAASDMISTGTSWLTTIGTGVGALALVTLGIAAVIGIAGVIRMFIARPA